MTDHMLIRGGTVVHRETTTRSDVLVVDGIISLVGEHLDIPAGATIVDAEGCWVGPGLVDLHTHLREPGGEEAETVASGARAGVLGGYSAVMAMPNTFPAIDCSAVVAQVLALGQASCLDVAVAGAITVGRLGERLAPLAEMAELGVTFFTDDGTGVQNAGLMRRAMEYARGLNVVIADHCEDEALAGDGCMNESSLSSELGLVGRPALAEEVMVARDLALAQHTGCELHLLHLSTVGSAALVAQAKHAGVNVTAEVAPHHLILTEELCREYDPLYKVHPPLRTANDVEALRMALRSGGVDAVATDHAPHAPETKDRPFAEATPGMLGLQHAFALTREALGGADADPVLLFRVLSRTPAKIARLTQSDQRRGGHSAHGGEIAVGEDANLVVIDPEGRPVVRSEDLASKSRNTPYEGRTLLGAVRHTIVRGEVVVNDGVAQR